MAKKGTASISYNKRRLNQNKDDYIYIYIYIGVSLIVESPESPEVSADQCPH